MYTKEQFLEDVISEVRSLRVLATGQELMELLKGIDPTSDYGCIYGTMTGDCKSDRAIKLIQACCRCTVSAYSLSTHEGWGHNGAVKPHSSREVIERRQLRIVFYSPLEAYIMLPDAQNNRIIDYLTGKTNELELTP